MSRSRRASAAFTALLVAGSVGAAVVGWRPRRLPVPAPPPFAVTELHGVMAEVGQSLSVTVRNHQTWAMGVEIWCESGSGVKRVPLSSRTVRLPPEVDSVVQVPLPPSRAAQAVSLHVREALPHLDPADADARGLLFALHCDYGGSATDRCPEWPRR